MTRSVRIAPDYIEEDMTPLSVFIALPAHLSVHYDLSGECQKQAVPSASPTTELPE